MNVVVPLRRLTPAEEVVIGRAEVDLSEADDERRLAIATLRREGLPHRRIEAWHYTDLRALVGREGALFALPKRDDVMVPLLPNSHVIDFGQASPGGIDGVAVERTGMAPDWRQRINHLDRDFDTVRLLATAFGATGVGVRIEPNRHLDQPLELRAVSGSSGEHGFVAVELGSGSSATIVERLGPGRERALSTSVVELTLGDEADVLWIIDQARGAGETHLGQLNVTLGKASKFRLFVLNAGGAVVRQEIHALAAGEGADIRMRGVNLIDRDQHIDITTSLNHVVAHTTATEVFRNVVFGGHGVFQGMIRVARGAQKTDSKLACNTLLLSDDGDFSAKPELEIFADDVLCGHGATVAEIDANHLFYLMSRGIPEPQARALLIRAFVDEVVEEFEDEALVAALEARIDSWLGQNR